jgi:hypothetical protein
MEGRRDGGRGTRVVVRCSHLVATLPRVKATVPVQLDAVFLLDENVGQLVVQEHLGATSVELLHEAMRGVRVRTDLLA